MKRSNFVCFEPEISALDKAQELAWDAMKASSKKKQIALAEKA